MVFHGRVLEKTLVPNVTETRLPGGSVRRLIGNGRYEVRFQIEELFRGDVRTREITIRTNEQSSACGFNFRVGADYVVFTYRDLKTSELWVGKCGRTHELISANDDEDLLWMRNLSTAPPTVKVFGKIWLPQGWAGGTTSVSLHGPVNRKADPDEHGAFTFDGLPAGAYTLALRVPDGLQAGESQTVNLQPKSCAVLDWSPQLDTHIRGHVHDAKGNPVAKIEVEVTALAEGAEAAPNRQRWTGFASTDESGAFDVSGMPQGDYRVEINRFGPSPQLPYFPQIFGAAGLYDPPAKVNVGATGTAIGVDFTLPLPFQSVSVPVTVLAQDGTRVEGARITAFDEAYQSNMMGYDASLKDGTGSLPVYAGETYRMTASDSLLTRCGGPVRFKATPDSKELVITLDQQGPNCSKRRIQNEYK